MFYLSSIQSYIRLCVEVHQRRISRHTPNPPRSFHSPSPFTRGKVKTRNFPQTHTIRHSTASSVRLVERVAYIELHSNISLSFFEILSTWSILSLGRYDKTCSACYTKESQSSMTFHPSGNLCPITRPSRDFSLYKNTWTVEQVFKCSLYFTHLPYNRISAYA